MSRAKINRRRTSCQDSPRLHHFTRFLFGRTFRCSHAVHDKIGEMGNSEPTPPRISNTKIMFKDANAIKDAPLVKRKIGANPEKDDILSRKR